MDAEEQTDMENDGQSIQSAAVEQVPDANASLQSDESSNDFETVEVENGVGGVYEDLVVDPDLDADGAIHHARNSDTDDQQEVEEPDPLLMIPRVLQQQGDVSLEDVLVNEPLIMDADELPEDVVVVNEPLIMDGDSSSSSSFGFDSDEPVNQAARSRPRRWFIPASTVHTAIRELIAQGRRSEGGVATLNRDNFMQRMRRMIFSMNHSARNRPNGQRDEGDGDGDHSLDAENDSGDLAEPDSTSDQADSHPEEEEPENCIRFDTNLPAEHSYLGANMNRVSGVNYLDVGQQYNMMLFVHQHILFPGEVLPFMIPGSIIESDIDAQNGLLFGVCFPMVRANEQDDTIYGVTCQIYEKGTGSRGNTLIKSRALQRFVTKGSQITGPLQDIGSLPLLKCYGFVKILPEIYLREPLTCIDMGSMSRLRDNPSMQQTYKRYQAATTPWPVHIYEHYSISTIIEKARAQLEQHKIDTMPTDPTQLSFWLVRNLHLSDTLMKQIFMTDCVNIRMKMISSTFKEDAVFICRYCGNRIANCRSLFAMSKHGVQTQYCNSAGYIHETNTVYNVLNDAISYSGDPSTEFSWFPGYQWHIVVCKICSRHIGWEFKALEPNLVPKSFFGISSSCVRVSSSLYVPTDPHAVIYRSLMRLARRQMQ